MTTPHDRGFTAGLWDKRADSYPLNYNDAQIAQFIEGHAEGQVEAKLRRKEAQKIARIGYHPDTVAVKGGNGRIIMLTHEQYARHLKRREK